MQSKLQSQINEFRLSKGIKNVIVLSNKLTFDKIYENLDDVEFCQHGALDNGMYYLFDGTNSINLDVGFDTSVTMDNIRGGSCNGDSYINLRNYTPNLDRIARDIANRIK